MLTVGVVALLLAGAASGLPGDAYTASSAPTAVLPSSTQTYTVAITNDPLSVSRAKRARITVPSGFTVNTASVSATTSPAGACIAAAWVPDGALTPTGPIGLKSPMGSENELCPGGVLTVSFNAQAATVDELYTWTSELRRDDPFVLNGSQPTVRVDGTPPATTIDSGPAGATNDTTPNFAFSSNESGSSFDCRIDVETYAPCTSPYTTAELADGPHSFEVRATDPLGNTDATPAARAFIVDTVSPDTTVDSGPSGPTNDPTPTFEFSADQGGSSFECGVDGGAFAPCSSPHTTAALTDGAHTFDVRAIDPAGNVDATPAGRAFSVDTTTPDTRIEEAPVDPTTATEATFSFSSGDAAASFECRLDSGAFAACTSPRTLAGLTDGIHTFEVRAVSALGTPDPTPATHVWRVDTTAPQTSIDTAPPDPHNGQSPSIEFSASEAATFECALEGAAFAECTSPRAFVGLADGIHTFSVRATDLVGHVDPTPAEHTWRIDTIAPQTTIDGGPSGLINDPTPTFAFSADDGSATSCRIDSGLFATCTSPHTTAALTEGSHMFEVRATDAAGNVDPTPAIRGFNVDVTAPQTTIDGGPTGAVTSRSATFTFSSEATATFQCSLDGAAFSSCASPAEYSGLAKGSHIFRVKAIDQAGNEDPTPAERSWSIVDPTVSISDVTVPEGDAGASNATFTVSLSAPTDLQVSVAYATANGTATAPADYAAANDIVTFAPGETTKTVAVAVNGDLLDEPAETFSVNLSSPVNATIADGQATGTITDDDGQPAVSVNDVTVTEGNTGTVNATFSVSVSSPSGRSVTVDYATANGTASAPADFASTGGSLSFAPGETTKTVTVPVNGDLMNEGTETYVLGLSNSSNATIADANGIGTIIDDDGAPTLSVNDVTVLEGDAGSVAATFTVSLSPTSGQTVSVGYSTANGTATAPGDYTASGGNLIFATSQTALTVTVQVNGDTLDELDEQFSVTLSNPVNATIGDGIGVGTITDDDGLPSLSVNDIGVAEGQAGTVNANFSLTLSAPSSQTVTVDYATADGTASAGTDYEAANGIITFAPGATTRTLTVRVTGDVLDEVDETFTVSLSNPTNATVADGLGLGTITDDDAAPSLSVSDVAVTEGDASTVNATFTVTLNAASGKAASVGYTTADGTATAPPDYTAATGTLTFAAGQTSKTVAVIVNGDTLDEANETFMLTLAGPVNVTLADATGVGTITDDDGSPSLALADVTIAEGDAGTTNASFNVTLSAISRRTVTVTYATANGTATTPGDYTSTTGSLSFVPGDTTEAITVPVNGDLLDEVDETFTVNLSGPVAASVFDPQGLGTITDNDPLPALSVNDVTLVEGDAGTLAANFAVTLNAPSGRSVSVNYATANGTASAPADYEAATGSLTFNPGQTAWQVTVPVKGDTVDEAAETYFVDLSAPTNATLADGQGVGTIIDDDGLPSFVVSDVTVAEGNSGTASADFTVTLTGPSGQPISVGYTTGNATATAGADYTAIGGSLVFAAGQTTSTLTVPVTGDIVDEVDETFLLSLANPVNADIGDGQGQGTITDDDPPPALSVSDVDVAEGNTGTVAATFTVNLNAVSAKNVVVEYATANGTATAPSDYAASTGLLEFAPGEIAKGVTVVVNADALYEPNETFTVNLATAIDAVIVDSTGVGTILNDDPEPPPPPLPPEPPPAPPPPALDTTPPVEVTRVRVKTGDKTITLSWANPSEADFQSVSVRRIGAGKTVQNLNVYEGRGTTFTDRGLKNGSLYRYRIRTRDRGGNESVGVVVNALLKTALFAPVEGAIVTAPPLLRWVSFPRATYYNAQLYLVRRHGQAKALAATKVLSIWPKSNRYKLQRTWRYNGKRYRLVPGRYRWYVWPGLGKAAAKNYGPLLGESTFTVKAK